MNNSVEVTSDYIASGRKNFDSQCPIALAIRDAMPESKLIFVGVGVAQVEDKFYDLTSTVMEFIRDFDRNNPVEPFRFKLIPR